MTNDSQTPRRRRRRANVRPLKPVRDRVISFRLNAGIPEEAEALAILDHHLDQIDEQGRHYTPRYVLTQALLMLDGIESLPPHQNWSGMEELAEMFGAQFSEIKELIQGLRDLGFQQASPPKRARKKPLPGSYLNNLMKAVKRDESEE